MPSSTLTWLAGSGYSMKAVRNVKERKGKKRKVKSTASAID